ncbi:PASTA domain-containing protein [Micromonospora sp. ATCC 39149]|uniref:PASTA domain-containing protein n=1 Tax=Micromonospora carbonacea TaxID=47853 RepID=A0A7D6CBW3_9ACTN|nr:PASTA domain-containing protein [Micromonospora sp. ATCC 39149]QLJ98705.1 PASTA domain-containing protein [Micromonospora carbonacea]
MSDDRQDPLPDDAGDETRPLPKAGDETRPLPEPAGGTPRAEPVDPTRALPRSGGTAGQQPAGGQVWSGRAGVPPPRSAEYRDPAGEWYGDEQPGRRWWTPILLGVVALLLLGLLGAGLWLALSADDGTGPRESPSVRPTSAPATTGAPTTEATSGEPSTTPPSTTPAGVPMPPLVGLPRATAERILDRIGVDHRVETRDSDRPAGTVLETDPEAGALVPAGAEVTLVVAVAPTPTTSTAEPTTTATATP